MGDTRSHQAPGFNVQPQAPAQTNPMASLLVSLVPSQQALKQGSERLRVDLAPDLDKQLIYRVAAG